MKILLHSSKTMKPETSSVHTLTVPLFMKQATYLNDILAHMDAPALARLMAINEKLASSVEERIANWSNGEGTAAVLTFRGDIYSGLAAATWNKDDAAFAQDHLLILSGLYGLLRPFDKIKPYRLEMGYKLRLADSTMLDVFWENQLVGAVDTSDWFVNLTSKEYYKVVEKQLCTARVISPKFLTVHPTTKMPVFVTVHAKIARGSFAHWLIKNKIDDPAKLSAYNELGYVYDTERSTEHEPVFVCHSFGGIGMSVRLA